MVQQHQSNRRKNSVIGHRIRSHIQMAAMASISFSNVAPQRPSPFTSLQSKPLSKFPFHLQKSRVLAKLGGGDGDAKRLEKKFITREEEPEQYWQTAGEREGENPMKTPLPYIIIFGMSTPFVILAIAFANGWIKVPVR
ncbi:uncharacterized protein LOC105421015 [Amborella trichopoda]|uniref:uncharacterized protein LOC105421015 n=1 Tax=Amborella trichopoda TaxID=13333 RepID=UPI0005D306A7|nr:uncharacterized protein LOC105421015 [Amborella trichopoda]|eukprot:XP_011625122.1 uncharacterized protein LOC105421015 [Amborella trichopoda]